ncbi:MAG: type II secretion system F family protein [Lentisphaeria bacterium]|nr:type II secretion system F family protein [Lentisphaeria bacterium]
MARRETQTATPVTGTSGRRKKGRKVSNSGRIRRKELPSFTRRLSAMLDAGLPLIQCLEGLAEQTQVKEFRHVLINLRQRVEGGNSFAEALAEYRLLFGDLYVNMIRAGELGGSLSEVTSRLASYLEASAALRRKIFSAAMYPLVILILAGSLTVGMLLFIVPTFKDIYDDFNAELPGPTNVLILISDIIRYRAPYVILGLIVGIIAFVQIKKTEKGGLTIDRWFLKLPVFGMLIEKIALARFSRTFASLLRSGVPILRSVEIVSTATGNKYIGRALKSCAPEIEGGKAVAVAMKETKVFPPMILHMMSVGEKTGNIDGMLEKIADFYEDEVSNMLDGLSSMIEPLLMAVLGIVIGGIVIAMFMPIFSLHKLIS